MCIRDRLDPIKPTILAVRIIPNIDRGLAAKIGLADHHLSLIHI